MRWVAALLSLAGLWRSEVTSTVEGGGEHSLVVVRARVPPAGKLCSLLRACHGGECVEDPRVARCRAENAPPPPPPSPSVSEPEPEPPTAGDGNRRLDIEGIARGERPRLQQQ